MLNRLKQELLSLARNCPKNGFVLSTQADIIFLKQEFKINDLELCKVLGEMNYKGLIDVFVVEYGVNNTIYKYRFK